MAMTKADRNEYDALMMRLRKTDYWAHLSYEQAFAAGVSRKADQLVSLRARFAQVDAEQAAFDAAVEKFDDLPAETTETIETSQPTTLAEQIETVQAAHDATYTIAACMILETNHAAIESRALIDMARTALTASDVDKITGWQVRYATIDGPAYHVTDADLFAWYEQPGVEMLDQDPPASVMDLPAAYAAAMDLIRVRVAAKTGEAWDCAPHRVRLVPVVTA